MKASSAPSTHAEETDRAALGGFIRSNEVELHLGQAESNTTASTHKSHEESRSAIDNDIVSMKAGNNTTALTRKTHKKSRSVLDIVSMLEESKANSTAIPDKSRPRKPQRVGKLSLDHFTPFNALLRPSCPRDPSTQPIVYRKQRQNKDTKPRHKEIKSSTKAAHQEEVDATVPNGEKGTIETSIERSCAAKRKISFHLSEELNLTEEQNLTDEQNRDAEKLSLAINSAVPDAKQILYCLIDVSGSMYGERIRKVTEVLQIIASDSYNDLKEVGLFCFNHDLIHFQPLTPDRDILRRAISYVSSMVDGGTNTYHAIVNLMRHIQTCENKRRSNIHLVIMTDANDWFEEEKLRSEWNEFKCSMERDKGKPVDGKDILISESTMFGSVLNDATTVLVGSEESAENAQLKAIGEVLVCEDKDFETQLRKALSTLGDEVKFETVYDKSAAKPMEYMQIKFQVSINDALNQVKETANKAQEEVKQSRTEAIAITERCARIANETEALVKETCNVASMSRDKKKVILKKAEAKIKEGKDQKLNAQQILKNLEEILKKMETKIKESNERMKLINDPTNFTLIYAVYLGLRKAAYSVGSMFKKLFFGKEKKELPNVKTEEAKQLQRMLYTAIPDMPKKYRKRFESKIDKLIEDFGERQKSGTERIKNILSKLVKELGDLKEGKSNLVRTLARLDEAITHLEMKDEEIEDTLSEEDSTCDSGQDE